MCPDSVSDIKIQHHTDLRGHRGLLGQMFIIILKLLSLWGNGKLLIVGRDMESFIRCHWLSCKMVLLKDFRTQGL